MMKNSDYWRKRFTVLENASHSYGQRTYSQIESAFIQSQREIQAEIDRWYARFAANNGVTLTDAKKLLSSKELAELKWDVNEYIQFGRENAMNKQWMKQLENASARFHITRLEALQLRTQQAMEVAFGNQLDHVDKMARHILTEDYYRSIFEVQKGFNIGWNIGQVDEKELNKLVVKPWAADGKNFSDRIWQQKQTMIGQLHQELTRTLIQGKTPNEAIKHLEKYVDSKFKNARYAASRLVMTEQAYFHSVSQAEAFKELDVEEFEIIATLDNHTSEICQKLDSKHYPMKEYEAGVTAPPFHPNCRCVTAPYFEDNYGGMRAARDEHGKTYYVPDDMTYKDWKKSFVNNQTGGLTPTPKNVIIKMGTISDNSKLGTVHGEAMKKILENSPDSVQKAWNKYADKLDVIDAHAQKGAFYSPSQGGISLNIDNVAKGEKCISRTTMAWEEAKKPYYTAFHEFGHNISALMAKDLTGSRFDDIADVYKSKKYIRTVMVAGQSQQVGYTLTQMMKEEGEAYVNSIFTKLKAEAKAKGLSAKTVRKSEAWDAIKQEMLGKPIMHCTDVSDMWDGISNGSCVAHYGHTNANKQYWKSISVGTEGFAEMFSATVMNPDSVTQIKHFFPKSYDLFLEILKEMGV